MKVIVFGFESVCVVNRIADTYSFATLFFTKHGGWDVTPVPRPEGNRRFYNELDIKIGEPCGKSKIIGTIENQLSGDLKYKKLNGEIFSKEELELDYSALLDREVIMAAIRNKGTRNNLTHEDWEEIFSLKP